MLDSTLFTASFSANGKLNVLLSSGASLLFLTFNFDKFLFTSPTTVDFFAVTMDFVGLTVFFAIEAFLGTACEKISYFTKRVIDLFHNYII